MHDELICQFILEIKSIQESHSVTVLLYMVTPNSDHTQTKTR